MDRRTFLASLTSATIVAPTNVAARELSERLVALARGPLAENAGRIGVQDVVAIVDFSASSAHRRFHIVDMRTSSVVSLLVAHGRGSDPAHSGWLKHFSNAIGSNATSSGAYRTGPIYEGKYGRSMRLVGLDPENSNAEARAIVIHPAWYVSDEMIGKHGKLGRSEGCFALSSAGLDAALAILGPGRLLLAGKFSALLR